MSIKEILRSKKGKYDRCFILENDKITNAPLFTEIISEDFDVEIYSNFEVKDNFILTISMIEEIFGQSEKLNLDREDRVLIIAI